jgi:hypothetical protein
VYPVNFDQILDFEGEPHEYLRVERGRADFEGGSGLE